MEKQRKKAKKPKPHNYVRGETNTLELAKVGQAINLRVYKKSRLLGRMFVGQGGIAWLPAGTRDRSERKQIPWDVLAVMMREWPFGSRVGAGVKFARGAVEWRAPGKKGRYRRVRWDDFTRRMEMRRPKAPSKPAVSTGGKPPPAGTRKTRPRKRTPAKPRKRAASKRARTAKSADPTAPKPAPAVARVSKIPIAMADRSWTRFLARSGTEVKLHRTGTKRKPGPIQVWAGGHRGGEIRRDGLFRSAPRYRGDSGELVEALRRFNRRPKTLMREYGYETGQCSVCGRELTNPISIDRGIGPICEGR